MTRRTLALFTLLVTTVSAQGQGVTSVNASAASGSVTTADSVVTARGDDTAVVPFKIGELARYDVKFDFLHVGEASAEVMGIEDLRGHKVWHTAFRVKGGTLFYHVNDLFESWFERATLSSLRFYQTQQEGSRDRTKRFEIYPDKQQFVEMDKQPPRVHPGVDNPLDDGSFLFFIRSMPLVVGKTYEFNRYFRPEKNPVVIRVLRRETITVPAGKFQCIVVQPIIKTQGIFSEHGQAEVWLTDDPRHVVVQLKSHLSFGSINLYLKSYKAGA